MGVGYEVYNLQAQANETAGSLVWMFATRADTLVGELAASCYSEQNLDAMIQALHGSLINTLEGGYNTSSIMNALDGIAGGLHGVASAARDAAGAMAALGAAQAGAGSGSSSNVNTNGNSTSSRPVDSHSVIGGSSGGKLDAATVMNGTYNKYLKKYAKGGIVTKEKNDPLNPIAEAVGEDTIIAAKEGEGVFTKEQTEALIRFAESVGGGMDESRKLVVYRKDSDQPVFTSAEQFREAVRSAMEPSPNWNQQFTVDRIVRQPEIASNNANKNNVTIHYDNMINIQGDVNDANHIVKQIENVATGIVDKAIKKSWKDASMTLKYGSY